jgi:CheY-like chemotaxis protein
MPEPRLPRVLIVDDNADKLVALEAILLELDVEIVKASSGREALRYLLAGDVAVVLLDVRMPGMDGFETAALIRERPRTAQTPIIFVTAFGDDTHEARGYSLRAVDYLLTPVVPEVLRTKVSVLVELYRRSEEVERQAEALRQRAQQLHALSLASHAINSAMSPERILGVAVESARDVLRAGGRCARRGPRHADRGGRRVHRPLRGHLG